MDIRKEIVRHVPDNWDEFAVTSHDRHGNNHRTKEEYTLRLDSTRLKMAVRIATGAVAHVGGSEGFAIGRRSRHNFPRNIGRRLLPYKALNCSRTAFWECAVCSLSPSRDR
ncbi:hypothetical protein EVAR_4861_1 [Eumeta japonica]|uniref:Uncharacterized protein n=1 Tax=Eumeta variegata TaxID=151549 RepID=A0A4C1SZ97_EUMVA|nr:hypothetical protein EVAR_4861_1 [Eumeta japonica]